MNDEQIFELAEKLGFQDDYGRWNFNNEGLLDFVFEVQKALALESKPTQGEPLDSAYPDGDGYWSEK